MYPIKANKLRITSKYGPRSIIVNGKKDNSKHNGIDLVAAPHNSKASIVAFEDGVVHSVRKTGSQWGNACFVRLKHANGKHTMYMHMKSRTIPVDKGDKVKKGQFLGTIGKTGYATGVHLHFQIDKGSAKTSEDPYPYLFEKKPFLEEKPKLKSNETIAEEVWAGKWGNNPQRKKDLIAAGYDYDAIRKIVNATASKKETSTGFKKGDRVKPIRLIDYKGRKLVQYDKEYEIVSIDHRGAVLAAVRGKNRPIWAVLDIKNLRRL